MNRENQFGSGTDYYRALAKILEEGLHDNYLAILQAHYSCPEHTATWQQLADFVGYQGSHAINLQYG